MAYQSVGMIELARRQAVFTIAKRKIMKRVYYCERRAREVGSIARREKWRSEARRLREEVLINAFEPLRRSWER
jgi:hypothetical protein